MFDSNDMVIAAVLAVVLPNFVFPKIIYLMCEAILQMDGILLVIFIPMMLLMFVGKLRDL